MIHDDNLHVPTIIYCGADNRQPQRVRNLESSPKLMRSRREVK
jgi:hypothetical protein